MAQHRLAFMTTLGLPTLGLAAATLIAALAAATPARSQHTVDLQLVLAIDASGSVDGTGFNTTRRIEGAWLRPTSSR